MIFLYSLISIFTAWIWVDYYRLIDIYNKESLKYFIITFLLGAASVIIVLALNAYILDDFHFELKNEFLNDFLYCVFKIGMVEELAKTVPFFIVYYLFKDQIDEPIDYLIFISISALGFSAAENTMYFNTHGPEIINGRAILSTVGHMFDTSLIAYGIIRYKYYHKKNGILYIILFFFLAALAHGFYDFWLMYEETKTYGIFITILYFLFTISIFAVILNNAINNSSFFTYKKVIDSAKVSGRLLLYYAMIFLIQFLFLAYLKDMQYAVMNFKVSLFLTGFIIVITVVRLSRFKLIQNRWENISFELPFSLSASDPSGRPRIRIRIKGESYNEASICKYYEEFFYLNPVSTSNTYIQGAKLAFMERKVFLKNYETLYLVKVFTGDVNGPHEKMLLKPKMSGNTEAYEKYIIVGLLQIKDISWIDDMKFTSADFDFMEWTYIKPHTAT